MIIRREYFANYPYCIYLIDTEKNLCQLLSGQWLLMEKLIQVLQRLNFNMFDSRFLGAKMGWKVVDLRVFIVFLSFTAGCPFYSSFRLEDTRILDILAEMMMVK